MDGELTTFGDVIRGRSQTAPGAEVACWGLRGDCRDRSARLPFVPSRIGDVERRCCVVEDTAARFGLELD
jgi:hypothetical protein